MVFTERRTAYSATRFSLDAHHSRGRWAFCSILFLRSVFSAIPIAAPHWASPRLRSAGQFPSKNMFLSHRLSHSSSSLCCGSANSGWRAYSVPDYPAEARKTLRLLQFHPTSLILAVLLIAGAWIYKKHFAISADQAGFPGYFTVLVVGGLLHPSAFSRWRGASSTGVRSASRFSLCF